jgi:Cdc6-like AAA superfamily ATPase
MTIDLHAVIKELNDTYPCREAQFSSLASVLGHPSLPSPPALYLTGFPGTGKRTVTRAFLEALNLEYVWVDCAETISSALLFDRVVNGLRGIGGREIPRLRMGTGINNFVVEVHDALRGLDGKIVLVRP